jgi:hypothetical protein
VESSDPPEWHRIPADEWAVYRKRPPPSRRAGHPLCLRGSLCHIAEYTGSFATPRTFDIYVRRWIARAMIQVMGEAGLTDTFDRLAYDRSWIYRASQGTSSSMPSGPWPTTGRSRRRVARLGPEVSILGEPLRAIPIEELIWSKLYVLQHDAIVTGPISSIFWMPGWELIDWDRLLSRSRRRTPANRSPYGIQLACPRPGRALPLR